MRRSGVVVLIPLISLTLLFSLLVSPAVALTVGEILSAPERFDQKDVRLIGVAENVQPRVSRRGNEYTTFKLADGTGRIKVFSWGSFRSALAVRLRSRGSSTR